METVGACLQAIPTFPGRRLEFAYDAQGRRIQKRVSSWNSSLGTWNLDRDTRFFYDGWNLLAEFDALPTLTLTRSYTWGLDLSGSTQGAGGVGGLLFVAGPALGASPLAPCFDGNGNLIGLVDLAAGTLSADLEYSPFGETIKALGPAASAQPFGFSTKYTDSESDLLYYGLRYYSPSLGRWLSSDPIEERGGINLYVTGGNDVINNTDSIGLTKPSCQFCNSGTWTGTINYSMLGLVAVGGSFTGTLRCTSDTTYHAEVYGYIASLGINITIVQTGSCPVTVQGAGTKDELVGKHGGIRIAVNVDVGVVVFSLGGLGASVNLLPSGGGGFTQFTNDSHWPQLDLGGAAIDKAIKKKNPSPKPGIDIGIRVVGFTIEQAL